MTIVKNCRYMTCCNPSLLTCDILMQGGKTGIGYHLWVEIIYRYTY